MNPLKRIARNLTGSDWRTPAEERVAISRAMQDSQFGIPDFHELVLQNAQKAAEREAAERAARINLGATTVPRPDLGSVEK